MKNVLFKVCVVCLISLGCCTSCKKEPILKDSYETILDNDPQQIELLWDWPQKLLQLFGEEHVFFGDVPPLLSCGFTTQHKYVEVEIDGMDGPPVGTLTPIYRYFKFEDQYIGLAHLHCFHTDGIDVHRTIYPVNVTGVRDEGTFTAYFTDIVHTPGTPVHKVIVSGRLTDRGIEDYRYGYEIVAYLDPIIPDNVYPVHSVFVFEDVDGIAEYDNWHEENQ